MGVGTNHLFWHTAMYRYVLAYRYILAHRYIGMPRRIHVTLKLNNFTYSKKWVLNTHCMKNVQIRSFFWSVFSHTRAEYGDLPSKLGKFS